MRFRANGISGTLAACSLAVLSAPAFAQETVEADDWRAPEVYGSGAAMGELEYSGDELLTRDGLTVVYRLEDYDGFTAQPGSNATFVNMQTGQSRTIVPTDGKVMLLNLDIIYADTDGQIAAGYAARVGTQEQYVAGRVDLIVGRFSDLSQTVIAKNIQAADSPTFILDNSVAMVIWPENDVAQYTVVDLSTFEISRLQPLDLPLPVELQEKDCSCDQ